MAYIGLYGVYYALCDVQDGVLAGFTGGAKTMGKAISASFAPEDAGTSNLYANNGIAETDGATSSGGTLTLGLDRLKAEAIADLFGLTATTEDGASGFNYTGAETANPVGVAFIRQKQEDNVRDLHEVVIYSYVTFKLPSEDASTLGESIEWQTPEIEGTISGGAVTSTFPWKKVFQFSSQSDAIDFIDGYFSTAATT